MALAALLRFGVILVPGKRGALVSSFMLSDWSSKSATAVSMPGEMARRDWVLRAPAAARASARRSRRPTSRKRSVPHRSRERSIRDTASDKAAVGPVSVRRVGTMSGRDAA